MPLTVQQVNTTARLLNTLATLKQAYYQALQDKEAAALIGIPQAGEFPIPSPNELDHLTRQRIVMAHAVVDALQVWMNTAIDLDGAGNAPLKKPLDAVVEAIR